MSRDQRIRPREDKTWTDFARARWDGLSRKQAAAVACYLEWRVDKDGLDVSHNIAEALTAYWYARAAGNQPVPFENGS
jgi:hypothetical protein